MTSSSAGPRLLFVERECIGASSSLFSSHEMEEALPVVDERVDLAAIDADGL